MPKRWDPRAEQPKETQEFIRWLAEDMDLFRSERPDLPQSTPLKARDRNKVIRAWNDAREAVETEDAAKISPEWEQAVRKFHRTRTITFPLPKARNSKRSVKTIIKKRGA